MHSIRRVLIRICDAHGNKIWVEADPAVAQALREKPPKRTERPLAPSVVERRKPRPVHTHYEELAAEYGGEANAWEGPHIAFDHLLGQDVLWQSSDPAWFLIWLWGPGCWTCRFCGHEVTADSCLPVGTCCLGCQRTGQDRRIGQPTDEDLARRPAEPVKVWHGTGALKGGKG